MLKNYFKIAFRNLYKQKVYSSINIFGLALGIASCTLIALYVYNEWSYDSFHTDSDRIYRSWGLEDYGDGDEYFSTTSPIILKPTLEANIPEVELVARRSVFADQVKKDDASEAFSETIQLVDPEFFSIFDFELLDGNANDLFKTPNEVVLTRELAQRYFGDDSPLQQTMLIKIGDSFESFVVSGVIEEAPTNSSIQYSLLIPFEKAHSLFRPGAFTSWFSVNPETYVKLTENAELAIVEDKLLAMMKQVLGDRYEKSNFKLGLQSITDIHLNTEFPAGIASVSDPTYSYMLGAVAFMVLIIACINFMTLSVSKSTSRAKEVGIRKTIGAQRVHLMYQFWGEAILTTLIALGVGIVLTEVLLPYFNVLSGTELNLFVNEVSITIFAVLVFSIGLVAGMYPALILSSFKPIEVLKGKFQIKGDKSVFRQGMVAFQFTISIFLIACTLMVNKQLDFLRSTDLGFEKEQTVILQTDFNLTSMAMLVEDMQSLEARLESELATNPSILSTASSVFTPAQQGWIAGDFKDGDGNTRRFNMNFVDPNYINTMGLKLVEGRAFSEEITSDSRIGVVVNEALVKDYNWDTAIGKKLPGKNFEDHEIIGVVEDFNYESLYAEVEPLALSINPVILFSGLDNVNFGNSPSPRVTAKIAGGNISATMESIETAWGNIAPGIPFNFVFLDEAIDSQYRQEERLSQIVVLGSVLAILIACMGLFGLASLTVARRTKEIGVRKVLGASSTAITLLLNKQFTKLVIAAFFVGSPLAWYAMSTWLNTFAYKAPIGVGIYLIAGFSVIGISWITVSFQSLKASFVDPIDSLRSE